MDLQLIAKQNLIDFDSFEATITYDPYRHNNILKDTNCNWSHPFLLTTPQQKPLPRLKKKSRVVTQSDRHSLKMLLVKLDEVPSPEKQIVKEKVRKVKKPKVMCELSTTEAVVGKRQMSTIRLNEENKVDSCFKKKIVNQKRPTTTQVRKKSTGKKESLRPNQLQKVRNLIKQKLAQKLKEKEAKRRVSTVILNDRIL